MLNDSFQRTTHPRTVPEPATLLRGLCSALSVLFVCCFSG